MNMVSVLYTVVYLLLTWKNPNLKQLSKDNKTIRDVLSAKHITSCRNQPLVQGSLISVRHWNCWCVSYGTLVMDQCPMCMKPIKNTGSVVRGHSPDTIDNEYNYIWVNKYTLDHLIMNHHRHHIKEVDLVKWSWRDPITVHTIISSW